MDLAEDWLKMAEESLQAARELYKNGYVRSAISRAYYAGYQAATALLHQAGEIAPPTVAGQSREAWNHEHTPRLMVQHTRRLPVAKHTRRYAMALRTNYKWRIASDYFSQREVAPSHALDAIMAAGRIVKAGQACIARTP